MNTLAEYESELEDRLIDAGLYHATWFNAQISCIKECWEAGESVDMAYYKLKLLARQELPAYQVGEFSFTVHCGR